MRRKGALILLGFVLSCGMPLLAEQDLSSDQLRRMYDDAVAQMKTAQDRRNELARENEKLRARIAQLEKELEQTQARMTAIADSTFKARSERAAFAEFMEANPGLKVQWYAFLQRNLLSAPDPKQILDTDWPLPRKP